MIDEGTLQNWAAGAALMCWPAAGLLWAVAYAATRGASPRARGLAHAILEAPWAALAGAAGAVAGVTYRAAYAGDPLADLAPILGIASLALGAFIVARLVVGAVDGERERAPSPMVPMPQRG